MIGVYNYTVIVTYIGVTLAVISMVFSCNGYHELAILFLTLAGICDTFDGRIARTKKDRTDEQVIFGVQIDSLCDLVCFGVTPAILAYNLGVQHVWGIAVEVLFVLCGVIRLAYFNVLEEIKKKDPERAAQKGYRGMPITTIVVIFPSVYLIHPYVTADVFAIILAVFLVATAFLYVLDIRIKKPGPLGISLMITYVVLIMFRVMNIVTF